MDLNLIYHFAKDLLEDEKSGHDWLHALRVEKNALKICPSNLSEKDIKIIKVACWLHDTIDPKITKKQKIKVKDIRIILDQAGASSVEINEIIYTIQNLSYSDNLEGDKELSLLGQIVQDADRLDAIGAIGIARAFYYGGSQQHALYNDEKPRNIETITEINYKEQKSIINHFYEKLLHLQSSMNTPKAKKIASKKTSFMELFLAHFYQDIHYDK